MKKSKIFSLIFAAVFFVGTALAGDGSGRLVNVSTRLRVDQSASGPVDGQIGTAGFWISGPGKKSVVIRQDGLSLGALGIPDPLSEEAFILYDSHQQELARSSASWNFDIHDGVVNDPQWNAYILGTAVRLGSKPDLVAGTPNDPNTYMEVLDVYSLDPGGYTAEATTDYFNPLDDSGAQGITLITVDDADPDPFLSTSRLINISTRGHSYGNPYDFIFGGFWIAACPSWDTPTITNPNGTPETETVVLIGGGKEMEAQGVTNVLKDPVMEVHTTINGQDVVVATNDDWDGAPPVLGPNVGPNGTLLQKAKVRALTNADCDAIYHAHLMPGSKEPAMVLTIPNGGGFTVEVHGKVVAVVNGENVYAEGNAIFEIFEANQVPE